ncbi:response regulator, partial [Candidatus Margulisiibacteriota bacterium]
INKEKIASIYFKEAYYYYGLWGATAKQNHLNTNYARLLQETSQREKEINTVTTTYESIMKKTSTGTSSVQMLDIGSIVKSTLALAKEIELNPLIEKLLEIIVETAGAQKVILIRKRKDNSLFYIEAAQETVTNTTEIFDNLLLKDYPEICKSIVQYVIRTKELLVIDNAIEHKQYSQDEYIKKENVKSLLCQPIIQKDEVLGIIYLENNIAPYSFNKKMTEIIDILASQVAVFLENAELYENLNSAKIKAEASSKAKTRFVDTMSHELITPIFDIIGINNSLLKRKDIIDNKDIKEPLTIIQESIEYLSDIIQDILTVQEFETKVTPKMKEFKLALLLDVAKEKAQKYISKKSIKFNLECNLNPEILIKSDFARLRKTIEKLIKNAALFTEKGEIHFSVSLSRPQTGEGLRSRGEGSLKYDTLLFEISDTGMGIAKDEQQNIFDPFTQVDQTLTRKVHGIGLGLPICKKNIECLNGEIKLTSQIEKGTKVEFWVPYIEAERQNINDKLSTEKINEILKTKKILYCDDETFNLFFLEMILKDKVMFTGASNAKEAIQKCYEQKYDLILMDIQMPEMDGTEAMQKIRQIPFNKDTHIVALTAQAMPGDREKFLKQGFNDYINKPVKEDFIMDYILNLFII